MPVDWPALQALKSCPCRATPMCQRCVNTRNDTVMALYPLVLKLAINIASAHRVDPAELCQHAISRCLEKFTYFNPFRGISPVTYFHAVAKKEMIRHAFCFGIIRVPSTSYDGRRFQTLGDAAANFLPGGCKMRAATARNIGSLSEQVFIDSGEDACELGQTVPSPQHGPMDEAQANEMLIILDAAISRLSKVEKFVICAFFDGRPFLRIAKSLKRSRARVHQIYRKARSKVIADIMQQYGHGEKYA